MKSQSPSVRTDRSDHFSCSMSAVLLARVEAFGGTEAVREVLRVAVAKGAAEFSTVTGLEVSDSGPGLVEVVAVAAEGFPRSVEHCAWTSGLMTGPPVLFGLEPATVEHEECPWR